MGFHRLILLALTTATVLSCADEAELPVVERKPVFPEPVIVWTTPVVNKDRTYYMALESEATAEQWRIDAEVVVKTLFDAGLPLEMAQFGRWPEKCLGAQYPYDRGGLITVDLIAPDDAILDYGFVSHIPTALYPCYTLESHRYQFAEPQRTPIPQPEEIVIQDQITGKGILHFQSITVTYMMWEERLAAAQVILSDLAESGVPVTQAWMAQTDGCDCGGQSEPGMLVDVPDESAFLLDSRFRVDPNPIGWNLGVHDFWTFRYEAQ